MTTETPNGHGQLGIGTYSLIHDLTDETLLQFQPDERLWRIYVFRPSEGRATRLEHRIYTKVKPDGHLSLVTFAVHTPVAGQAARSGIARVPDLTTDALDRIIAAIQSQTQTEADEYEELDLSHLPTLPEQLDHIRRLSDSGQPSG